MTGEMTGDALTEPCRAGGTYRSFSVRQPLTPSFPGKLRAAKIRIGIEFDIDYENCTLRIDVGLCS